jgi:hypothetical protein
MATTIKSTELDFNAIKESLKNFLKDGGQFNDYDFDGSGINNILDVLAYNTHYNALLTNFALNESFLVTAQLRPSVVSLAESLGYIPDSKKSSECTINFSITPNSVSNLATQVKLLPGELVLRGTKDEVDYTFSNRVTVEAFLENGTYKFYPAGDPDGTIFVYEGEERQQDFLVGSSLDTVYVIPDKEVDISTAIVRVFEDQASSEVDGGSEFSVYQNLVDATTIDEESRLYVLRESPNGFYELSFGNGTTLGVSPKAGNVVAVNYLRNSGETANGIQSLVLASDIYIGSYLVDPNLDTVNLETVTSSSGGTAVESIESIRKNAPYQFSSQNRMVTANDYTALILKKYSSFISDIQSWGGQDELDPDFGAVYVSIVWKAGLSSQTISNTRQKILELAEQYSITSFQLRFQDPVETYIATEVFFQFNPALTGLTQSNIRAAVNTSVEEYFAENTGSFGKVFRLSNLLTDIDATDPSVLSSRAEIVLNRRVFPQLTQIKDYVVKFPVAIRDPVVQQAKTVYTSEFTYKNKTVFIRNKLNERVRVSGEGQDAVFEVRPSNVLEIVDSFGDVVVDNIGSYDRTTGTVTITGLNVQSIPGGRSYIKLYAIPANKSVVTSVRNSIVKFDAEESYSKAVITDTE